MAELSPPSPSDEKPAVDHNDGKKATILGACKNRDLEALRELAESPGGFLTDTLREQAWPVLLGLSPTDLKTEHPADGETSTPSWKSLPRHRDEDQVQLDVNRAFTYYPNDQTDAQLAHTKSLLSDLIVSLLRTHPYLCYFQGYHDIAQVLLLTLPPHLRLPALTRLSLFHIRDFMLPSLSPAISQLRLIPEILRLADPPLYRHLAGLEPFFALSGTLTMYAHDVPSRAAIVRLFDALLAREPVFSVYLFAAIVQARREELFETAADDTDMLHFLLSKLPNPLDIDALIAQAARLRRDVPPERLRAWRREISRWSVLKTERFRPAQRHGSTTTTTTTSNSKDTAAVSDQNEKDTPDSDPNPDNDPEPIPLPFARQWFDRHVAELQRQEQREKMRKWLRQHRRPAGLGLVGVAVLVGVVAVLVQYQQQRGTTGLPGPVAAGLAYVSRFVAGWWSRR
ncbi:hypothetical protein VTJ49DRAFT_2785 [Mycothermus thermophilus]|uniref:Rab-GAP TBC domain-containing protein n=1 Tax=Humicola insolens TaxID=85995 RepID=A0ABR3V9E6_HUMIN